MIDKTTISSPTTHYGSGKHATKHFITQRVTGALNIAFLLFFIWFVVSVAGQDRVGVVATIANPFVAIPLVLLFVSATIHMRIGMIEVIEDYIGDDRVNRLSHTLNTVFAILVAVIAIGSIAKLVFWG